MLWRSWATCKLPSNKYRIRYEVNSSKRWDGREILLDVDWLESLYEPGELIAGKQVSLPWQGKGNVKYWNAVILQQEDPKGMSTRTGENFRL